MLNPEAKAVLPWLGCGAWAAIENWPKEEVSAGWIGCKAGGAWA